MPPAGLRGATPDSGATTALCSAFFVSERGDRLNYHVLARTFARLARRLGLRGPVASPQTIHAYRDAFRLLLTFLERYRHRKSEELTLDDLDAPVILAFLNHLEEDRANSVQSRNARLAAVRSFARFAALRVPESVDLTSRVLAIPCKRAPRRQVHYLTRPEMDAILTACDRSTHGGRRDHVLLLTLYNTGARVSELVALRRSHVRFGAARSGPSPCGPGPVAACASGSTKRVRPRPTTRSATPAATA